MSRYQFTTPQGYHAVTVEAPTAAAARERAVSRTGRQDLLCTHLSDHGTGPVSALCWDPDTGD